MKKDSKYFIFVLFVLALFLFVGCSSDNSEIKNNSEEEDKTNISEEIKVIDGWSLKDGVLVVEKNITDTVPWEDKKSEITSVIVKEGVTSLPDGSFMNCFYLTNIDYYQGYIMSDTEFWNCFSLQTVNIYKSEKDKTYGDITLKEEAFRDTNGCIIHSSQYDVICKEGILFPIPINMKDIVNYNIDNKEWLNGYFTLLSGEYLRSFYIEDEKNVSEEYSQDSLFKISLIDSVVSDDFELNRHDFDKVFAIGEGNFAGYYLVVSYSPELKALIDDSTTEESEELNELTKSDYEYIDWISHDFLSDIINLNTFFAEGSIAWKPPIVIDENIGPGGEVISPEVEIGEDVEIDAEMQADFNE